MNDKEYAAQKSRIEHLAEKWMQPLGLKWWHIKLVYNREADGDRDDGRCCVAYTTVDWHYLLGTITFNMQAVAEQSDGDLENQFVHECCHILINEMRMWGDHDKAIKHEERVATTLASAFIWTKEAGKDEARPKRKK